MAAKSKEKVTDKHGGVSRGSADVDLLHRFYSPILYQNASKEGSDSTRLHTQPRELLSPPPPWKSWIRPWAGIPAFKSDGKINVYFHVMMNWGIFGIYYAVIAFLAGHCLIYGSISSYKKIHIVMQIKPEWIDYILIDYTIASTFSTVVWQRCKIKL